MISIVWVVLFFIWGVIRRYIIYSFSGAIIAFFSLIITRNSDAFFSCPARIETPFIVFLISTFSSAKAIDRFSAVFSASAKSLL